jgi:hypothetical protein
VKSTIACTGYKKKLLLLLVPLFVCLSLLCRVFTTIHLKQIMFVGYTVLQVFCS